MFDYYQPTKIHFGKNRVNEIGVVASEYGNRCLLVTTASSSLQNLYDRVKLSLAKKGIKVFHFDDVKPNPPIEIIEKGIELVKRNNVDFVLAVGGGSSIDTAKAIAFKTNLSMNWEEIFEKFNSHKESYPAKETSLPILSIPTTSGTGSQVTQAAVITDGEDKISFYHPDLFSKEAIIDPQIMTTLPKKMSAATGFDTFTHAFESYVNKDSSILSRNDSIQALKLVIEFLPKVVENPTNVIYREKMALADTFAGKALSNAGADTPHPLSEIIGGICNITHGEALAIVYPAYISKTLDKHRLAFNDIASLFKKNKKAEDLEGLIINFLKKIDLNKNLSDYNISDSDFQKIVKHPVLNYLPFGSKDYFVEILDESR